MGKQKYTAKEKKVSRMTRNGLVEENLATKETRKVTNSDQELPYKQKDVEQAFITSEKKKNSHKKAEKKQFSEKVQEGNPAKKEEAANSPPGKRKTQGRYRYRDKPAGVSVDSAVEIRERKEKHRSQYQRQKKKQQRLQFGKLETDGSLKKEKKTSAETDGGHFQAEKNDVSTNRKKGKQKYSRKTIKTYQEVDKAARKQEAERQNKIPKDSVYTKKTNEEQKAKVKYHLYFDKKTGKTDGKKKTLSSVPKKALKNAVYQKAGEDEEENSAVDAAHKLVRSGEWILQEHSSRNIRKNRSQIHKENRLEQRAWKSASRYQYQKYLEEHPEMQKKLIRKLIQKQRIKREYQMAYRAGKIAKETKDTSIRSVNLATKIARKALPSGIFCTCNVILQRIPDHKSILRLHSPFFFCHAEDLHIRLDHAHTCRHDQLILCKPFIKSQYVKLLNLMGKRSVGDHAHFHSGSFAFVQQLCHYP